MDKHIPEGIEGAEPVPFSPRVKRTHLRWRVPVKQIAYHTSRDIKEAFVAQGWRFAHTHYLIHKDDPTCTTQHYLVFERLRDGDEILTQE